MVRLTFLVSLLAAISTINAAFTPATQVQEAEQSSPSSDAAIASPAGTTLLTSTTAIPAYANLASREQDGLIDYIKSQFPTHYGGPDCVTDDDPRCTCCQWRFPAKPQSCGKMKCCPCWDHFCDPKDLHCTKKFHTG